MSVHVRMSGVRLIILSYNTKNIIIMQNNIIKILFLIKKYNKIKNDKVDQYYQSLIHSDQLILDHKYNKIYAVL